MKRYQLIEHYIPLDVKNVIGTYARKEDARWMKKMKQSSGRHPMSKYIIVEVEQ